jgi:UDP-N-acetylglucosamine---dolichyl-phosphate N-acetylglucosaminyltransferase
MKLIILIPAYNEESKIGEVLEQVLAVDLEGVDKEIIVIDDGSPDRTGEIARSKGVLVIQHIVNRGVGGAIGTGFEAAILRGADVIVTCDADGQHSAEDIGRVVDPVRTGHADAVLGSRMINATGMPWTRRMANGVANLVTLLLFGIRTTDSQSGLRAFSRSAAKQIRIRTNRYEVNSEMCGEIRRHRLKYVEVPIQAIYTHYSLSKGQGFKVGLKTLIRLILAKLGIHS